MKDDLHMENLCREFCGRRKRGRVEMFILRVLRKFVRAFLNPGK